MKKYDVVIIGGGVVGCMIARFLSKYDLAILILEKASDIGSGTSAANSALIHAGYDPPHGTLKAALNVRGNAMFEGLAKELEFDFDRRGDYVIAIGNDELPALEKLLQQGKQNGVSGLQIVSADYVKKRVPLINPDVSGALWAPSAGICDTFGVTIAVAENAVQNGVDLALNAEFKSFIIRNNRLTGVQTQNAVIECDWAINAAGLYADDVMRACGDGASFTIRPRRGEYCVMDSSDFAIDSVLFPVPDQRGKGVLVFPTTHGNTILGPTSEWTEDKEDKSVTVAGQEYLAENVKKLIPSIDMRSVIGTFAGLRAAGNAVCKNANVKYNADFIVEKSEKVRGVIHVAGIESPGLSASPAIAERVIEILRGEKLNLREKKGWNPLRKERPRLRRLPFSEREKLIQLDARYGKIICRCEMVSEGEIVAEINAPIPARTYDAIKRRTWTGAGRCQGGFDMVRVVEILARELGKSPAKITKKGAGSEFICRPTKSLEEEAEK